MIALVTVGFSAAASRIWYQIGPTTAGPKGKSRAKENDKQCGYGNEASIFERVDQTDAAHQQMCAEGQN
jgi:hypothetical protein